jgi:hypothetical protein
MRPILSAPLFCAALLIALPGQAATVPWSAGWRDPAAPTAPVVRVIASETAAPGVALPALPALPPAPALRAAPEPVAATLRRPTLRALAGDPRLAYPGHLLLPAIRTKHYTPMHLMEEARRRVRLRMALGQ